MVGKSEDAGSERKAAIDGFDRRGGLRRLDEDWRWKQKKKDAFFLG